MRAALEDVPGVEEQLEVGVLVRNVSRVERELEGVHLSFDSAKVRVHAFEIPSVEREEDFDECLSPAKSRTKADLPVREGVSFAPGFEHGYIRRAAQTKKGFDVQLWLLRSAGRRRCQGQHCGHSEEGYEGELPHDDAAKRYSLTSIR